MPGIRCLVLSIGLGLCAQTPLQAQITAWQLGGDQPWAGRDTVSVMIDFAKIHTDAAMQRCSSPQELQQELPLIIQPV